MADPGLGATPDVQPAPRPAWLDDLVQQVRESRGGLVGARASAEESGGQPRPGARSSAVLVLFGPHPGGGCDVVLTERSGALRSHAGQVSFPGGSIDPGDPSPTAAALREAQEEVGVEPDGVEVAGELPALYLPPSRFYVTPVLAWWARPAPLRVVDPREVAVVARVPIDELTEPANRFTVTHPSGWTGPAFEAGGLFVWGFTAGVLSALLDLAGLDRPWDVTRRRPLPEHLRRPVVR